MSSFIVYRYVVKQLIDHEFFAEGDVKVEVVDQKDQVLNTKGDIMFRMEVPHKESKKDRQESVEFAYNLHSDVPENVVEEMVGVNRVEDGSSHLFLCKLVLYMCISFFFY